MARALRQALQALSLPVQSLQVVANDPATGPTVLRHLNVLLFECLKNQIGEWSPVRRPGVAGVGETILLWMWRKPHAALVHLD
jgi:hypothetical protein